MSAPASSHATAELLSAYLDERLTGPEVERLEAHLEECQECQGRLEGLRVIVGKLRQIESIDPPEELEMAVARRIALSHEGESVLDRFESALSVFNRQSTILPMLGIVIALGVFIYLFAWALDRDGQTPVIFSDPPGVEQDDTPPSEVAPEAGDRLMRLEDGVWIEEGVDAAAIDRTLVLDSEEGRQAIAERPELERLPTPAVIQLDGETVEIQQSGNE